MTLSLSSSTRDRGRRGRDCGGEDHEDGVAGGGVGLEWGKELCGVRDVGGDEEGVGAGAGRRHIAWTRRGMN